MKTGERFNGAEVKSDPCRLGPVAQPHRVRVTVPAVERTVTGSEGVMPDPSIVWTARASSDENSSGPLQRGVMSTRHARFNQTKHARHQSYTQTERRRFASPCQC
jgi:hypothetical protein